jgi:RNA polymerase sigma-70 factor, ECF subfamily
VNQPIDPKAAAFVEENADRVWRLCLRLSGGCREDAEDLLQETLLVAWRSWERFLGKSRRTTWLHAIAVRLWQQRRARRREFLPLPLIELAAPDLTSLHDLRLDLASALERLPDDQRIAFLLVKAEGRTHREAAQLLKAPLGTVQYRVHEATRKLRSLLEEKETPCPIS